MNKLTWVIQTREGKETPINQSISSFIKDLRNEGIRVSKSGIEYELSNGSVLLQRDI